MNGQPEFIEADKLLLDPQNPRLPKFLRGADEPEIITYMLKEAATLELMLAIGENNFFPGEPLLVVKDGENYRVIEGNRRLTAIKLLRNPDLATIQRKKVTRVFDQAEFKLDALDKIPCLIFPNESPIHKFLGYRHITGIQAWDLTQKAAFLYEMKNDLHAGLALDEACRELAKMIGSRRDYVKRLIVGYEVFTEISDAGFFDVPGLDETTFFFNYIADSLNKGNIASFLGVILDSDDPTSTISHDNLRLWTTWFFEKNDQNQPRIRATSDQLKKLDAILGCERALTAFCDGKPLNDAYELTAEIDSLFVGFVVEAKSKLEQADSLTHVVGEFYDSLDDDLKSISRLVKKIRSASEEDADDD